MDGVVVLEDIVRMVCNQASPARHMSCDWLDPKSFREVFKQRPLPVLIFPLSIYAKMEALKHGDSGSREQ